MHRSLVFQLMASQVAGLRGQLSATATRGKTAKGQLVELHEALAVQKQRLDSMNKKKEAAQRKLAKEQENVRSAGEAGDAREAFHTQVAARLQQLQQRVKASRDSLFGIAQKLAEEKATLKMKRGGLSSSKNALRSLHAQLQQQEAEKSRQQELLYSIDFQCQAMQRRVSRISGYKTAAETKALQKQMKELQAESSLQQEEQSMLSSQVKHLDGELRKAQRTLARVDEEDSKCANNVGDIRLACASLDRELQTIVKQKEKLVLAESLRKLEVTRLYEELEACADASLEAENRKVQQQLQVQEALAAIELELDGARGQLRAVEEERRKLTKEAAERRSKISALEARYENLVQSSQTADGAGRSQAYYVIRVGQEREELQRKGAEMHRRLQSASVEVQGLEASLRDVSLSNSRLRSRLQQETGALGALREQRAEKEGALFLRNRMAFTQQQQICLLKEAIEKEERCLQQTRQQHQCTLDRLRDVDEERRNVEKESNYVDEKLQRSIKQRLKLQTSIQKRRAGATPSSLLMEEDGELQFCNAEIQYHAECLKGMLQSLYQSMGPTVASEPAAFEILQRVFGEGEGTSYCMG
ncbi:S-formylglutathione hydrolase, related [Eimeria praecox]|uniref:S-formylglutathione hydrolase, related n=1 Tax=Eimeria praecox TaxID=51316 RepID=U6H297_9EIME|nr:S-formylglutathione hydrolase, related [Eimeria praecox]